MKLKTISNLRCLSISLCYCWICLILKTPFYNDEAMLLSDPDLFARCVKTSTDINRTSQDPSLIVHDINAEGNCPPLDLYFASTLSPSFQQATRTLFTRRRSVLLSFLKNNFGLGSIFMLLLAVQFAVQPLLTKAFIPKSKVVNSSILLTQDLARFVISIVLWRATSATSQWDTLFDLEAMQIAGIPAVLVAFQNSWALIGYQHLQPITFNALNQTKTVFAALSCYLLLNQYQSKYQMLALLLLVLSALIMESLVKLPFFFSKRFSEPKSKGESKPSCFSYYGVFAVLASSFVSGLNAALSQKFLCNTGNNVKVVDPLVFSAQLSLFSAGLMIVKLFVANQSEWRKIKESGFLAGWSRYTLIPIVSQAVGGILAGLVVKHAGVVRKGFALIGGLFLSGLLQNCMSSQSKQGTVVAKSSKASNDIRGVTPQQWAGGALAAISLWMHASFPYKS